MTTENASSRIRKGRVGPLVWLALAASIAAHVGCRRPDFKTVGGVVLRYMSSEAEQVTAEQTANAIRMRIPPKYFAEVREIGDRVIEVKVPGADPAIADHVKSLIAMSGKLEFRLLAKPASALESTDDDQAAANPGGEQQVGFKWVDCKPDEATTLNCPSRQRNGATQVRVELDKWNLSGDYLTTVSATTDDDGRLGIAGSFNDEGAALMKACTEHALAESVEAPRHLGVILDDRLISAPRVVSVIAGDFRISGDFSEQEVETIVAVLKAGVLPAKVQMLSEERVPPRPN